MSEQRTRRDFVKLTTAALALSEALPASAATADQPNGEIEVHVTAGSKRYAREAPVSWRPASSATDDTIVLNPRERYQDVLGFGAAFTDAACYTFNRLDAGAREQLFHELFHPAELGLNVCRTCIGSSDYARNAYSFDEGEPDPELRRFSIEHDLEYIVPIMKQARAVNPDLFLFSSPWSPPGWMKSTKSMLGGTLHKHYYAPYAMYFVKFLQAYAAAGVPINAVTVQNEVDTDQDSNMPACLWGQEYEVEFVAAHLGPQFAKHNIDTKIWIIDHNYNLWGRAIAELDDPGVNKYVDGIAWHGYLGTPDLMTRVHDAHPEKNAYWTEGGPDYKDPGYFTEWTKWGATYAGILRNWARSITGWNLALDEVGKPNIGPFSCGGMVQIHSQTKEITRSGQYWGFAHYSKAVKRGAVRIDSRGALEDGTHVAFVNPDGSKAMVLTNAGANEKKARIELAGKIAEVNLPGDSVVTLTWR
ncbi:MAG TPA: glycoside hydrolase family 30 beta sandwich domain-containing protein [Bryobacteraceae bacterium]|nr:glycoside hydrolase family 30 beta sandwich domain-containing protein [Bryobacteraceae bacterium]